VSEVAVACCQLAPRIGEPERNDVFGDRRPELYA
jgi:hypothetical protein